MKTKRADIQGLRALAVVLVILDHYIGWPSGGYVGVDVFFVISGFLITSLLLDEHSRTGTLSFVDFYKRRARRILPAAVAVLGATVLTAWLMLSGTRAEGITWDAIWAAAFVANWDQALSGTDYMSASGAISPLQHYWSLSIEEQFYFVWPLAIIACMRLQRFLRSRGNSILLATLLFLSAASFAWAIWETSTSPTWAYFSTASRAWELATGALLALLAHKASSIPDVVRPVIGWLGMSMIFASALLLDRASSFPGPLAAVPVLGSAAVILSGTGGGQAHLLPITNRVSGYIGDLSYSLYLWHFPVIIIGGSFLAPGRRLSLIALAITVILSILSYHLIEDPIRRSGWLYGESRPVALRIPRIAYGIVPVALILALGVAATTPRTAGVAVAQTYDSSTPLGARQVELAAALSQSSWPALSPSPSELGPSAKASEWVKDGCLGGEVNALDDDRANASRCIYGAPDAPKLAMLIGDSIAISWLPAIRSALEPQGFRVAVFTMQQCPAVDVTVMKQDRSPNLRCEPFRKWAYQEAVTRAPDLVILSSAEDSVWRIIPKPSNAMAAWNDAIARTMDQLAPIANKVVFLDPPPVGHSLAECVTTVGSPSDCVADLAQIHTDLSDNIDFKAPSAMHIRVADWFCLEEKCPGFVGHTPVFVDGAHLTDSMSQILGPLLAASLAGEEKR